MRGDGLGRLVDDGDELVEATWSNAIAAAAAALSDKRPDAIGVLGGARLTLEAQYAWAKLIKGVLGVDNIDAQLSDGLPADAVLGLPRATIDDACRPGGVVIWLGPDPKEEARQPLPAPASRHRRRRRAPDRAGAAHDRHDPPRRPLPASSPGRGRRGGAGPGRRRARHRRGWGGRRLAGRGRGGVGRRRARHRGARSSQLAESSAPIVEAANVLYDGIDGVTFLSALRRGNVHGALDMGLAPGLLPGRVSLADGGERLAEVWPSVPADVGRGATAILEAAAARPHRDPRAAGGRPTERLPRSRARRTGAGEGDLTGGRRPLRQRLDRRRPGRCRARGRGADRGGRHLRQPRGAPQRIAPEGHAPRDRSRRLDPRRRARGGPRRRPGARGRSKRSGTRSSPLPRRTPGSIGPWSNPRGCRRAPPRRLDRHARAFHAPDACVGHQQRRLRPASRRHPHHVRRWRAPASLPVAVGPRPGYGGGVASQRLREARASPRGPR